MKRMRGVAIMTAALSLGLAAASASSAPVVNEVLASHTGTDNTEFAEIYGAPGESLDGLSLIVVESDASGNGTIDRQIDFGPADVIGTTGFFLVGNPAGLAASYSVTPDVTVADNFFENSSLTIALVETSSISGGSVTGAEVVRDAVAMNDGDTGDSFFFGAPVVGPDGSFFPAGVRRIVDGQDTDTTADFVISDFGLGADNTPTSANGAPPPPPPVKMIHEIQGDGATSPLVGETVTIEGVVTGVDDEIGASFTGTFPEDAGIFVQEEDADADGDDATSEGIFVGFVRNRGDYPAGTVVRVTGLVKEKFGQTILSENFGEEPEIIGTAPVPDPVTINKAMAKGQDASAREYYESLEGMRVRIKKGVANSGATNRFGEVFMTLGGERKRVFRDSVVADLVATDADAGAGDPDNPFKPATPSTTLVEADLFDELREVVGPLGYSFSHYKVMVQEGALPQVKNGPTKFPFKLKPRARNKDFRVASLNVENFFPVGGSLDLGTVSQAEYEEKRDRLADAIDRLLQRPQVVAVQEVVDATILQDLADAVGGYTAYLAEGNDDRGIDVGFLIRNDVPASNFRQLGLNEPNPTSATCSDVPGLLFDRPPVAIDVVEGSTIFTVFSNHFSSKSAPDACRDAQAAFVASQVADIEATNGQAVVAGDLNAFEDETPLSSIVAGTSLKNLWKMAPRQERYSFHFSGRLQTLDHILVTKKLRKHVRSFQYAHISNDYYARNDGHAVTDHDPPVVTFRIR